MQCPHCLVEIYVEANYSFIRKGSEGYFLTKNSACPRCEGTIIFLVESSDVNHTSVKGYYPVGDINERLVFPKSINRKALSDEIPENYKIDYYEACNVLNDSPKASAALSRRCLQLLLRDKGGVKNADLSIEIQQVIDEGKLPSSLSESIDAIRNIGNFAAHPTKSANTGEVVDVEIGEAEWTLDVLESLFDYYFVQPTVLKRKKDELNKKLTSLGKPPMK